MKKRDTISPSQLDALSCRLAWFWGYKRAYSAKRSSIALEFGTGIHYALEMYYGKKKDPVKVWKNWADKRIKELSREYPEGANEIFDSLKLGISMLEGYLKQYPKDDFDVLATESFITRSLPAPDGYPDPECSISVRLDGLVRDHRTEKLFSLEHKTYQQLSPNFFDLDQQFTAQVFAAQELATKIGKSEDIYGVIYNGLKKNEPSARVKSALFHREKLYRNKSQIEVFLRRAYFQYMESQCDDFPIFPQPNMIRCNMCDFREPCRAYMLGEDWRFILKENYFQRGKKKDKYEVDG